MIDPDKLCPIPAVRTFDVVRATHSRPRSHHHPPLGYNWGVTIHSDHPFLPPESGRDPLRRFRGRLAAGVSLWTTGRETRRGLTVSSMMIGDGEPGQVVGLIDEDSDLWDQLAETGTVVVSLLDHSHAQLSEAFAGTFPAPGGPFRMAEWTDTEWGPALAGASWLGARLLAGEPEHAGWALLVRAEIETVHLSADADDPLVSYRGRYHHLG